jgi:hypothetical protein
LAQLFEATPSQLIERDDPGNMQLEAYCRYTLSFSPKPTLSPSHIRHVEAPLLTVHDRGNSLSHRDMGHTSGELHSSFYYIVA